MPFKVNAAGMAALRQSLSQLALDGAQAGAGTLKDKLGQAGSGVHYPGQPNPSSRPGEYPARQEGDLQRSIAARPAGDLRAEFGAIDDPPPHAYYLHFLPPDRGGRYWGDLALQDEDIRQAVREAMGVKR